MVVDELVDPNLSTFTPLEQEVHSNIKYIGMGYMPCNGYVPCQVMITSSYLDVLYSSLQPSHLQPDQQLERIEGAMPCHDYNNRGSGPDGCW